MNYNEKNYSPESFAALKKEIDVKFERTKWMDSLKAILVAFLLSVPIQAVLSPFVWAFLGVNIGIATSCEVAGKKVPDLNFIMPNASECSTEINPIGLILAYTISTALMYPLFFRWYRSKRSRKLWVG